MCHQSVKNKPNNFLRHQMGSFNLRMHQKTYLRPGLRRWPRWES